MKLGLGLILTRLTGAVGTGAWILTITEGETTYIITLEDAILTIH